jgi:hypothetical protein
VLLTQGTGGGKGSIAGAAVGSSYRDLLRKSVPDLQSVQLQGDADGGVLVIEFAERLTRARARAQD